MSEKLVQDGIEEMMRAKGLNPEIRVALPEEMLELAIDKFFEEVDECKKEAEKGDLRKFLAEVGDVHDVLVLLVQQLLLHFNIPLESYQNMREKKRLERGLFTKRHVLKQK